MVADIHYPHRQQELVATYIQLAPITGSPFRQWSAKA
jgi:hypothetical protein